MSKSSWNRQLCQTLEQAAARKKRNNAALPTPVRVALVGVGNELNGDDAAGNQVAARLRERADLPAHFLAFNAGSIPENASGILRRFQPDWVIFVDAADFGDTPGEIQWLDADKIGGMSASSHTLPLPMLGSFLASELGCEVSYLGIQPGQLQFDTPLSEPVVQAVKEITEVFCQTFLAEN